jgi:hypothetical protein
LKNHLTPGCSNPVCEEIICEDTFCCQCECWDSWICVGVTGLNKKVLVLKPNIFGLQSNCSKNPVCNGIVCLERLACCEDGYDENCRQVALKEYELLAPATNHCFQKSTLPFCTESKYFMLFVTNMKAVVHEPAPARV